METMFDSGSVDSAIASSKKHLETRDAVVKYFQERYPGQKSIKGGKVQYEWKKKLVDARMALEPGAKRESINRQFQNDKKTGKMRYEGKKASPAEQERYKNLSGMLAKKYHIRGTLCISFSEGMCEARNIDITFTGQNAKDLSDNPSLQGIFNVYRVNGKEGSYGGDAMAQTQAGGGPCEEEDHENPKRPGKIVKGCTPSLFVTASFA